MLVKPAQSRRGKGVSEVHRVSGARWGRRPGEWVFQKVQYDYFCRPSWRLWRQTPTLTREHRCLKACHAAGVPVPEVLAFSEGDGAAELVLREVPGVPLRIALAQFNAAERCRMLRAVAHAIADLHRAGWVHGSLGSAHILVAASAARPVHLIDFEKARRSRRQQMADLNRLWRRAHFLDAEDRSLMLAAYRERRSPEAWSPVESVAPRRSGSGTDHFAPVVRR